jgi:LysR family transcriptional regulator, glycine cleavage system transcriptional activator
MKSHGARFDAARHSAEARAAALTPDRKQYLADVRDALSAPTSSTARLHGRTRGTVLRVHTMTLAAHEFLLPRLTTFRERFRRLELRIETSNETIDFRHDDRDAALRLGNAWPALTIQPLGGACAAVVYSPEIAAGPGRRAISSTTRS